MTQKSDIHAEVTAAIIDALESGNATGKWVKPWVTLGGLPRRHNGDYYQGINCLMLGLIGQARGFTADQWMTFNQAKALGGMVRKGEKSAPCTFYKPLEIKDDATGDDKTIHMIRAYRVFNVDQIDGLPDSYYARPEIDALPAKERNEAAEAAMRACGAIIQETGDNRAYYSPLDDSINLPRFALFRTTDDYLATMAHELTHWTGGQDRLARDQKGTFGTKAYAFEELVAEIGAAFICARLGVAGNHINSHADYIGSWLRLLKEDKKAIFRAAAQAQSAADLVLGHADTKQAKAPRKSAAKAQPAAQPARQFALAL